MNSLNLGSDDEPVVKKKSNTRNLKIALGLAAVILVPTIGSTLAGSITIGTGNAIEFGQGFTTATACDSDGITIVPSSILTEGTFNVETLTVSSINTETCGHKYFKFKILNSSNAPQVIGASGNTYCTVYFETTTVSTSPAPSSCSVGGESATGFTVAPATTLASSNVAKITLESSATTS